MEEAPKYRFRKVISTSSYDSHINNLDDGCLMLIFSFLSPIPDRYNTALVCRRWNFLACHPRLWLRVDRSVKDVSQPGVYPNIEIAVSAARPGDTILIAAGGIHRTSNIQIRKPLCLLNYAGIGHNDRTFSRVDGDSKGCLMESWIGAGDLPDDTTLICSRGSESALELLSTCKLANLTGRAELGCCLLHRSGRLTVDRCILQCESNPLDHLSHAIVTTAAATHNGVSPLLRSNADRVTVMRTKIEGGAKAVLTSGTLSLQQHK
ncbi:F-box protein skip5 [Orobanche gracilis]